MSFGSLTTITEEVLKDFDLFEFTFPGLICSYNQVSFCGCRFWIEIYESIDVGNSKIITTHNFMRQECQSRVFSCVFAVHSFR